MGNKAIIKLFTQLKNEVLFGSKATAVGMISTMITLMESMEETTEGKATPDRFADKFNEGDIAIFKGIYNNTLVVISHVPVMGVSWCSVTDANNNPDKYILIAKKEDVNEKLLKEIKNVKGQGE